MTLNRSFDVNVNKEGTLDIRINDDEMLSFKIDPTVMPGLAHYHDINPEKNVAEIIISELNNFYDFTETEVEEYTKILLNILEDD